LTDKIEKMEEAEVLKNFSVDYTNYKGNQISETAKENNKRLENRI
jgi:hypothetical protein